MQSRKLINKSNHLLIPCQLSKREFEKNNGNKPSNFEVWEYERIFKKKMDFDNNIIWTNIEFEDDNHNESNDLIEFSENSDEWQKSAWDKNIICDENNIKSTLSYSLPKLTNGICIHNVEETATLKFPKSFRRKTVLNYYPICVDQHWKFLEMNRHFFPLIYNEEEVISKQISTQPNKFINIFNGEIKNQSNLYFNNLIGTSAERDRLYIYETSEQHSPFRTQPLLTSELVIYSNDINKIECQIGVPRSIKKKSPFFGNLSEKIPFQMALENSFFRVPVYQHQSKSTDFLLILKGNNRWKIRKFDSVLLGGKQMPLTIIYHPQSFFFRKIMMKVICQLFLDMKNVPVDVLAAILSNVYFLNIEMELQKIAVLSNDRKYWRLKDASQITENDGLFNTHSIDDYMIWSSVISYLNNYEFIQTDKKIKKSEKKSDKKKYTKNPYSPWSISKSYLNGIRKGFWKLEYLEDPTGKNQMGSFVFVRKLVTKRLNDEKTDLRKLTVHETTRLLKEFDFEKDKKFKKKMKRWALVNFLSTHAATDLGGNVDLEKYARDTKTNRRNIRMKYIQQCQSTFENSSVILSNPKEAESENECSDVILKAEVKEITREEFSLFIKEGLRKTKTASSLPMMSNSENVKQLLENPLKQFILYRKKDGVVKKEKYSVNEYVLNYLKQAKSGRMVKKIYGVDPAKKVKQQKRDKDRRIDKYNKKRLASNLPIDINSQDTTDKVCSSCGKKGHIRTNQECPNYNKLSDLVEMVKSTPAKPKLIKQDSYKSLTRTQDSTPLRIINQKSLAIIKQDKESSDECESLPAKKQKLLIPQSSNKEYASFANSSLIDTNSSHFNDADDDDDDFIINIPVNYTDLKSDKPKTVKRSKSTKSTRAIKPPAKKAKIIKKSNITSVSKCAAPFWNEEIIFQPQDTLLSPIVHSRVSTDDDEFTITIEPQMGNIRSSPVILQTDSDSDDYRITIPHNAWRQGSCEVGEKENIFHEVNDTQWSDTIDGGNENEQDENEDDDDEFIINFSNIPLDK